MGKSPGKWIKTLFGKKSSRSDLSKGRASLRSTYGNEALVAAKAEPAVLPVVPSAIPQPVSDTISTSDMNTELDKGMTSNAPENVSVLEPAIEDADVPRTTEDVAPNDLERSRQENAATKAQAAFRGYLARRAFRALRGIIRLQALVRGHLVRRQAVATLCCIHGVVKLQALFRGIKIRNSGTDLQVRVKCNNEKHQDAMRLNSAKTTTWTENPSRFVFISKILRSSPVVMPLHLQYDIEEPNSARNWLERWTISSSWKPLPQQKKLIDANCETSEGNSKTVELEAGRPKRSVRRVSSSHADNGSVHSPSESAKPKRNVRKFPNHSADSVQERSQNELEKVKRSLRKVTNSTEETTNQLDVEIEKPKRSVRKASNSPALDVPNQGMGESGEKMMEDAAVEIPKHQDMETTSTPLVADELDDVVHNAHLVAELPPLDTHKVDDNENINVTNGEVISKEDQTSNETQKTKRRASFPAKQDYAENGAQNSPTVPSYMAATASAKAKLRGQGSPRLGLDGDEKTGFIRRHSLPSAPNGKLSSVSPRMQKLAQPNGKGGVKNDRSPLSSRDDKVAHADWRR